MDEAEVNGVRVTYEIRGQGPPLLLLHGFGVDRRMWQPQVTALGASYTLILCDMPGFGASEDPPETKTYTSSDMVALVGHLGFNQVHLCGLSYGGAVALEMAIEHPALIATLTLASSGIGGYEFSKEYIAQLKVSEDRARAGELKAAQKNWLGSPLFKYVSNNPHWRAALTEMVEDYRGWHWRHGFKRLNLQSIKHLEDVECPTLVVVGALDEPDFRAIAECLVERIPNVALMAIQETGHMLNFEQAEAFNGRLLEFLGHHPLIEVD